MNEIKGILFDKDGTLLDYHATWTPVHLEAARMASSGDAVLAGRLLEAAGADPQTGLARPGGLFAAGNAIEIADTWTEIGVGFPRDELTARLDRLFTDAMQDAIPVEGAAAALRSLRARGYVMGVASSDSEAAIRAFLHGTGIAEHIDFVAGYDTGHGHKPDPGMLAGFCAAWNLRAASVAVVGDNVQDLQMARTGGAGLGIGVFSGTGTEADLAPLADLLIPDICSLGTLLPSTGAGVRPAVTGNS